MGLSVRSPPFALLCSSSFLFLSLVSASDQNDPAQITFGKLSPALIREDCLVAARQSLFLRNRWVICCRFLSWVLLSL